MSRQTLGTPKFDKVIHSKDNAVYTDLLQCLKTKGINKFGLFMVFGHRAVLDCLESYPELACDLIYPVDYEEGEREHPLSATIWNSANELRAKTKDDGSKGIALIAVAKALFKELDTFGTSAPILVLHVPEVEAFEPSPTQGLEVLCALGDPANVGALLRSAAAFGASRVILLKESASPFHPKAVRAASAATLATPLFEGPSIKELGLMAREITALDMHGVSLHKYEWPKDVTILIGEEGQGVPDGGEFSRVSIPIASGVESLNATVAASIALYSYRSNFDLNA